MTELRKRRLLRFGTKGLGCLGALTLICGGVAAPAMAVDVPGSSDATIVLALENAPADASGWSLGEQMHYVVRLTNTGDRTYGFAPTASNLSGYESCKWRQAPANQLFECPGLITHTVTQEDVERGSFEPSITYTRYSQNDYKGTATELPAATMTAQKVRTIAYPAAKGFKPFDADPSLKADLGDLSKIALSVSKQYNIRIPALAVASNGDLLASYDKRPINGGANGGDAPNANSIMQRRSTDGGKTWGAETVIAQGATSPQRKGYSDPSYVVDHNTGAIFNFHAYSQTAGFAVNDPAYTYTADGAIDEANEHTMNVAVSTSTDNGHTWKSTVITDQLLRDAAKRYDLRACFMTSGAGTQKMQEPNKGRLLNQITCGINGDLTKVIAGSVYSDDDGATWHLGEMTTTTTADGEWRFDENKVVELSDGRLLMNSRTWEKSAGGYRIQAISEDGGEHWADYRSTAPYLRDPGNNAQIIRAYPNARPGTLRSKVLLFSNTNDQGDRIHGTISMSVDDGATWPYSKEFRAEGTGYTTMAVQPDGRIGLLMEPDGDGWMNIGYTSFTMRWLQDDLVTELKMAPQKRAEATVGERVSIPLGIEHDDPALADTAKFEGLPAGLSYDEDTQSIVGVPTGDIGAETEHNVTVTITEADDGTGMPREATASFVLALKPAPKQPGQPSQPAEDDKSGATKPGDAGSAASGKPVASAKDSTQSSARTPKGGYTGLASTGAASAWMTIAALLLAMSGAAAFAFIGDASRRRAQR